MRAPERFRRTMPSNRADTIANEFKGASYSADLIMDLLRPVERHDHFIH